MKDKMFVVAYDAESGGVSLQFTSAFDEQPADRQRAMLKAAWARVAERLQDLPLSRPNVQRTREAA